MVTATLNRRATPVCMLAILGLFSASGGTTAEQELPAQPAFAVPADAAAAISDLWEAWLTAYERADPETLAGVFTDDGIYAANTGQLLRGRAEIRDSVRGWIARRSEFFSRYGIPHDSRLDVEERVLRFRNAGDVVYRLSRFVAWVEPSRCVMDAGHLLAVWRSQSDSEWRLESLLVNRDGERPDQACG